MRTIEQIRADMAAVRDKIDSERVSDLYRDARRFGEDPLRPLYARALELRDEAVQAGTFDDMLDDHERSLWVISRAPSAVVWLNRRLAMSHECEDLRERVARMRKELREARDEIGRLKYPDAPGVGENHAALGTTSQWAPVPPGKLRITATSTEGPLKINGEDSVVVQHGDTVHIVVGDGTDIKLPPVQGGDL